MNATILRLIEVILGGQAAVTITPSGDPLLGPGVYVFFSRDGAVRYVGMTSKGIERPLGPGHKMAGAADVFFRFWPTKDVNEARRLEDQLIRALTPPMNGGSER